jgi:hypothetical protein
MMYTIVTYTLWCMQWWHTHYDVYNGNNTLWCIQWWHTHYDVCNGDIHIMMYTMVTTHYDVYNGNIQIMMYAMVTYTIWCIQWWHTHYDVYNSTAFEFEPIFHVCVSVHQYVAFYCWRTETDTYIDMCTYSSIWVACLQSGPKDAVDIHIHLSLCVYIH